MYLFETKLPDTCELPEQSLSGNIRKMGMDNVPFFFFFKFVFK